MPRFSYWLLVTHYSCFHLLQPKFSSAEWWLMPTAQERKES